MAIPEATAKGYALANDGDYVNLSYMESNTRRGRVGKGVSQTLLCNDNNGVVVNKKTIIQRAHGYNNGGEMELCPSITTSSFQENNFVKEYELNNNVDIDNPLKEASGVYTNASTRFNRGSLENLSRTLKSESHDAGVVENNLHIRKLTPRECGRLMGVSDVDITKMQRVNSNSQLYKQFGNSIVVDVLYYIFKQMCEEGK